MHPTQLTLRRIIKKKQISPRQLVRICKTTHHKITFLLDKHTEPHPLAFLMVHLLEPVKSKEQEMSTFLKFRELLKHNDTQLSDLYRIRNYLDELLVE